MRCKILGGIIYNFMRCHPSHLLLNKTQRTFIFALIEPTSATFLVMNLHPPCHMFDLNMHIFKPKATISLSRGNHIRHANVNYFPQQIFLYYLWQYIILRILSHKSH